MTTVTIREEGSIARPLKVLVPLIQQDFEQAEHAGMPFYRAAGEKLNEAFEGSFANRSREFYPWAERTFGKKPKQIKVYMSLVTEETKRGRPPFKSLQSFESHKAGRDLSARVRPRAWHDDVQDNIERARREAERIRQADLTRQQEREAEKKLALRLIDIGYKVLAKELHPDKGGDREAMSRLGRVRDRLKANA